MCRVIFNSRGLPPMDVKLLLRSLAILRGLWYHCSWLFPTGTTRCGKRRRLGPFFPMQAAGKEGQRLVTLVCPQLRSRDHD